MSFTAILPFLLGLALLVLGAELLVRGASRLAASFGISPLVIGLTLVAYGTSAPELAVSLQAVLEGQAGLSLGNVVGSNIFNVLFILGASALIAPLAVSQQLVRLEVPLLIGVSILGWIMSLDGRIGRGEGTLLAAGAVAYTIWAIVQSRRESAAVREEYEQALHLKPPVPGSRRVMDGVRIVAGLAILVVGSRLLVEAAISFAAALGVSETIIGLTLVAAGTSLPELATSIIAAIRGERDIAVGNVIGSNLFNLLAVLGLSATMSRGGLPVPSAVLDLDLPVMAGVAILCLPIFFTGFRIERWEAGVLLGVWFAYTGDLILRSRQSPWLEVYESAIAGVVLPLAGAAFLISLIRASRPGSPS